MIFQKELDPRGRLMVVNKRNGLKGECRAVGINRYREGESGDGARGIGEKGIWVGRVGEGDQRMRLGKGSWERGKSGKGERGARKNSRGGGEKKKG